MNFILRYGINNNGKRNQARKDLFSDLKNKLTANDPTDIRTRKHFKYRYVYAFVLKIIKSQ